MENHSGTSPPPLDPPYSDRPAWPTWWKDPILLLLIGGFGLLLGWLSFARYHGYNAGMYDLGNMAQSIWNASQGRPLTITVSDGQLSRLGLHVELIYYLFVPIFRFFPDPRILLAAQTLVFVLGAIPVYRIARRHTDRVVVARSMALIYLIYPTAQTSVLFDFHGDTLAMPLLLFALDAFEERAWRKYAMFVLLALSCKFYVALPVAGIGFYAFVWGGQRKAGLWTMAIAVLYGIVTFFIIRPMFAMSDASPTGSYMSFYFGQLGQIWATSGERLINAIVVFGPVMLIAWRGWRWLFVIAPVALAVLLSTGPGPSYDYRYHHYALVVPFLMMAMIEGFERSQAPSRRRNIFGQLGLNVMIVIIFSVLLVDTPFNPLYWAGIPGQGIDSSAYGRTPRDAVKDVFLEEEVPERAPLATSQFLGAYLANREVLYLVRYADDPGSERIPTILPKVDYVLTDALFDYFIPLGDGNHGGGIDYEREAIGVVLRNPHFALVKERDGLLLFERDPPPATQLTQDVEVISSTATHTQTLFGDGIALVDAQLTHLPQQGERRYRADFTWTVNGEPPQHIYVAISRLEGVPHDRTVHLPTYALHPTREWQPNTLIHETFEMEVPDDVPAGEYPWRVGWYVLHHPASAETDERSRLPGSTEVVVGEIYVPALDDTAQ
jgi:uncharacterized membrane protein